MNIEFKTGDTVQLKKEFMGPKEVKNFLDGPLNVRKANGNLIEVSKIDIRGERVLTENFKWEVVSDIAEIRKVELADDVEVEIVKKRPPVFYSYSYFEKVKQSQDNS